jgi:hypothetical protein
MTTTPPNLEPYKIEIYEGINDIPIAPNINNNGKGCNGAYIIHKFHGALDAIEDHFRLVANRYALYPEKILPFVPQDPDFLTYGVYTISEEDFACTLTPSPSFTAGYILNLTIPSGLDIPPGIQTYFAVKGGCQLELNPAAGVSLYAFDSSPYIETGHVWVLLCTGVNSYLLYRISAPKTQSSYNPVYIPIPMVKDIPLFTASKQTIITGLFGLKVASGSTVISLLVDNTPMPGLTNLMVTSTSQNRIASGVNLVPAASRVSLNFSDVTNAQDFETTVGLEIS